MTESLVECTSRVVHNKRESFDVYIGRPTKWGNPFSHKDGTLAEFKVASRDEAVDAYAAWVKTQPELLAALPELRGKVLGCWCAPQRCHGDVLLALANEPECICYPGECEQNWCEPACPRCRG